MGAKLYINTYTIARFHIFTDMQTAEHKIVLDSAEISYDGSIVYITLKGSADLDEEEADKHLKAVFSLTKGAKAAVLVDTSNSFNNVSPEARRKLAGSCEHQIPKVAEAVVIKQLHHRVLFPVYQRLNKPNNPVKAFKKREEALAWLQGFL